MKSFAVAALAAGAAASYHPGYGYGGGYEAPSNGTAWVTKVLTEYEQYCPGPTTFSHGGVTYTATEATTITVTNCPCTVSYPATPTTYSSTPTPYSSPAAPVYSSSAAPEETTPVSPVAPGSTYAPTYSVPSNATLPAGTAAPSVAPTKSTPESSPIASFTGAANKAFAASGASLAAVFGLVAYAL